MKTTPYGDHIYLEALGRPGAIFICEVIMAYKKATEEEKEIFARQMAIEDNPTKAFRAIRPDAKSPHTQGKRLCEDVRVQELISQFKAENEVIVQEKRAELCEATKHKVLSVEERRAILDHVVVKTLLNELALVDPQMINAGLKALDIRNKMDSVYTEKRQIEITSSLADVIKGVDKDAD